MNGETPTTTQGARRRILCLDVTRGLAILAMLMAHFAPGVFTRIPRSFYEHVPALATFESAVFLFSRFATPAFVTVFGLTAGFVYFDRVQRGGRRDVTGKLLYRATLLLSCAFLVKVPVWAEHLRLEGFNLNTMLWDSYTILSFYAVAVGLFPIWMRLALRRPVAVCLTLGAGHWATGWALAHYLWPDIASTGLDGYARFFLVGSPYGYFQLTGTALLAFPAGIFLRRALQRGAGIPYLRYGVIGAALVMGAGLAIGFAVNEFKLGLIIQGAVKAPPRLWYFAFFSGITMAFLGLLGMAELRWPLVRKLLYPAGLFGQAALPIYAGHFFAAYGIVYCRELWPGASMRALLAPMSVYLAFCTAVVLYRHYRSRQRFAPGEAPAPSLSLVCPDTEGVMASAAADAGGK